jgi:hypothetical protein
VQRLAKQLRRLRSSPGLHRHGVFHGDESYDLTIPDLTSLAGFPLASTLLAGEIEVTVSGAGWSGLGTVAPTPSNDVSFRAAMKLVKVTVP